MHCVDPGESFQTHIFLQKLASIQPRTSPVKFARSPAAHRRLAPRSEELGDRITAKALKAAEEVDQDVLAIEQVPEAIFQTDALLNFGDCSGAKGCKSCRA